MIYSKKRDILVNIFQNYDNIYLIYSDLMKENRSWSSIQNICARSLNSYTRVSRESLSWRPGRDWSPHSWSTSSTSILTIRIKIINEYFSTTNNKPLHSWIYFYTMFRIFSRLIYLALALAGQPMGSGYPRDYNYKS